MQPSFDFDSDHFPVSTILDIHIGQQPTTTRRLWTETNIQTLRASLEREAPLAPSATGPQEIDELANAIVQSINSAIDRRRPSPRAVAGFTKECKEAQMEARRLKMRAKCVRTEELWEQYRRARNRKARLINKAPKNAHREQVETASESIEGLWKVAKWAKNSSPRLLYVPVLRNKGGNLEDEMEEKVDVLKGTFFPEPPEADLTDLDVHQYMDNSGRKGRSTEHAIHILLERIYTAWYATGTDVASLLLLDVSGTFDSVSHPRLIHNLRNDGLTYKL